MSGETAKLTQGLTRCDEAAWRSFHARYFGFLKALALARGVPACEAEEVVQRVYLRVLRHAKVIETEPAFEAWLACLTRCEAIDSARRIHRRTWLGERFQQWQAQRREDGPPIADERLENALHTLSEDERRLLTRHYVDGWTQDELAAAQATSAKAIESKLARLRRRVRGLMDHPDAA
ncbi:RNA polymerase sigma factor [Luteolibacter sp. Populi]|uniref:RNA polymerase sigma factor n=1 Tax=Luteolibacter sp. Populi TaxID=3230487 RepID=UPI0034656DD8